MAVQRTARRKTSGRGIDRILNIVSAFPGGEDWLHGTERLLHRAGIRKRGALAVYVILTLLFLLSLAAAMVWLQRNNPPTSLIGGLLVAGLLGFMLPKMVLQRMVKRYRRKLQ